MCGLAGVYAPDGVDPTELLGIAEDMAAELFHRGPDDAGAWASPDGHAAFGFRRLSIIDLSEMGHQPMVSGSGRFTMVFNGEIYNYRKLRRDLERAGHRFRGHSDSEVLLASFEEWGLAAALQRTVGMFAIALWDAEHRELHLARDRLGIKPLFFALKAGRVLFGSELKALAACPWMTHEVDPDALVSFFRYLYVPGPRSIFRDVRKLEPGHLLTFGATKPDEGSAQPYWSLPELAPRELGRPFAGSDDEAIDAAEEMLRVAVGDRMYADVPVGALLSGGIDSSLVVALMQREAARPVRTYSVAFEEADYDEAAHAARIAQHLETDHTQVTLTPEEAWRVVPRLPEMFDEPFASPAAIPNYLICKVARSDVTVGLSGSGGDEVFAGYNRYLSGERLIQLALRVPRPARRLAASAVRRVPYTGWGSWGGLLPRMSGLRYPGRKAFKTARLLTGESSSSMYRSLVSAWDRPEAVVTTGREGLDPLEVASRCLGANADLLHSMLLADQLTYLVDDQLAMVDRVSMAVSLELRVPLLDHRLVEFSWRLPNHFKRREGEGKWVLRRVLERYVPVDLFDRAKMGLSVPLEHWLRGPLYEWASDTLNDRGLATDDLVDAEALRVAWERFCRGERALDLAVWASLMYAGWRERWVA